MHLGGCLPDHVKQVGCGLPVDLDAHLGHLRDDRVPSGVLSDHDGSLASDLSGVEGLSVLVPDDSIYADSGLLYEDIL